MKNKFPTWDREYALQRASAGPCKGQLLRQYVYKSNSEVFHACGYVCESGKVVEIPTNDSMLDNTKVYDTPFDVNNIPTKRKNTIISTINADCLIVTKELLDKGCNPCVMNLADAYVACGMYKRGSRAQEESLCRATTLSRSLFQYFKATSGKADRYAKEANVEIKYFAYPMDLNYGGIYSPNVTVFRDTHDLYSFTEDTYMVGIVSVAALDFNEKHGKNLEYKAKGGGFTAEGEKIMKNKIRTIFRIALTNGHDSLVAGAFGCGAFRLPADKVAHLFHEILNEAEFKNKFVKVIFAILDQDGKDGKFAPFYELFN